MYLFGSICFIRVASNFKYALGLPAASPAVLVPLKSVFLHSQELCALPLEYEAEEREKGDRKGLCLILIPNKEMCKHLDPGARRCVGSFSLNVAQSEKEELNFILHV